MKSERSKELATALLPAGFELQDILDLEDCEPDEAAMLMKGYEDDLKVPSRSFWSDLAAGLATIGEFIPIANVILAAIPLL
jgi:hypothetical protein